MIALNVLVANDLERGRMSNPELILIAISSIATSTAIDAPRSAYEVNFIKSTVGVQYVSI